MPDIVFKYFPDVSPEQKEQFTALKELYSHWNEKINVISRKDIDNLYEKHVLHSLAIAKVVSFKPGTEILDIGTGGGFPGIPLAILFPEVQFHLTDSIGKKITVVKEVAQALGLKNVLATHGRAEQAANLYEFIVSRAVARTEELYKWTKNKFSRNHFHKKPNGYLLLKGGDLSEELAAIKRKNIQQIPIADFFEEEWFEDKKVVYIPMG
jgi:16S rRNA (guanine527-N7)-methyltransferase